MRILLFLLVLLLMCSPLDVDNELAWTEGVMETENILGDWLGLTPGGTITVDGVTYTATDTVYWHIEKDGPLRNDSLYYTREYHRAGKNYDALRDAFTYGWVHYVSGDGHDELVYGHLRFRQPAYDSLWVKSGDNGWEKLRRR